ncbi:hypothetical protein E1301_Tti004972 [Triplophysa tibetana]|uniref:TNFR-Cys domain-containing protein n=1 Tax=Triplophysa tibetana TaxID=1572043 RepID=A0A5A9NUK5_9TELE|nr:hypothetical protein E1301_Tti004972 [Triplophysa tibetana]
MVINVVEPALQDFNLHQLSYLTGEYPTKHCSENNGKSVCGKCSEASDNSSCVCTDKPLCNDDECTECLPRPTCTHGSRLIRDEDTNTKEAIKAPHIDHYYYIMMACLTITVFICLLLVMYIASRRFKRRNHKKLFQPIIYKVALPSDACNCKLSKEEMGDDESDSKTTSELSLKCKSLIP